MWLMASCPMEGLMRAAQGCQLLDVPRGAPIFRAGSTRQGIGFVARGAASIEVPTDSSVRPKQIFDLQVGDHFGEIGLLLPQPHPFEVVGCDNCRVVVLNQNLVEELSTQVPAFHRSLAQSLSTRLIFVSQQLAQLSDAQALGTNPNISLSSEVEGLRFARVSDFDVGSAVLELLPHQFMLRHRLLPLKMDEETLTVGAVDPHDAGALRSLQSLLNGRKPDVVAISSDDFQLAVKRFRLQAEPSARTSQRGIAAVAFEEVEAERENTKAMHSVGDQVKRLTGEIVGAGIDRKASDIHIETSAKAVRVRFRIDGTLVDWDQKLSPLVGKGLLARYKVLGGLDIAERRRPQDGRISARVNNQEVDLRVSTLPANDGEKMVMRVFEAGDMLRPLASVFVEQRTLAAVNEALNKPYGAIMVAGPTGAGKSSTLYAALHQRRQAREDMNIVTIEDPIEYRLDGVTQVQVNHSIGLGFSEVLRATMRQDPDVIMVGEIRDSDTAQLALEAAMTGHLLFTSIHANDAPAVMQRLENLGCSRSVMAQSLSLILVQRLLRRLCQSCKKPDQIPAILHESLARRHLVDPANPTPVFRAAGCASCDHTGFQGRVALIESMTFGDEQRAILMSERPLGEVVESAASQRLQVRFSDYARFLMKRGMISASEALLAMAG